MKKKNGPTKYYDYSPDRWAIIKLTPKDGTPPHYRVFGTWGGSYLGGQSWKMNSGIEKVEEDERYFYFHGSSGSVYCCHKESYGYFSYGLSVLHNMIEKMRDTIEFTELPEKTNWMSIDYAPTRDQAS